MKKIGISLVLTGALALMVGCGSSGNPTGGDENNNGGGTNGNTSNTGTGYYIDSAVAGVGYVCGTESGTTDASGKFTFEKGKDCTFTLAGMTLREVQASSLSDSVNVVEDNSTIYTLLQTLDSDGNPDNGITILPKVVEKLQAQQVTLPASPAEVANIHEEIKNVEGYKGKLKTEDEAKAHVIKTQTEVTKKLLAGKTFYMINKGQIKTVTISSDTTKMIFKKDDGTEKTYNIEISTNTIVDEDGTHYVDDVTDKYILGHDTYGEWKFYFSEADAKAALDGGSSEATQNDPKALLAGKTVYEIDNLSNNTAINANTFNNAFSTVVITGGMNETINFTYQDGVMSIAGGG